MVTQAGLALNNALTDQQITTFLNLADLEEVESRPWARLKAEYIFNSFGLYTTGTISATQGSQTITGVGTTFTAGMVGMYFRTGATIAPTSQFAPIPIVAAPNATTLTLQTVYPYASGTGLGFQIFPLFYSAPGFQRIVEIRQQVPLQRRTHEWINFRDPYRTQQASPAVYWAPFGRDHDDNAKFEIWPIETVANGYTAYGLRGHQEMQDPTEFPSVPSAVVLNKGMMKCCEYLVSLFGDPRWSTMLQYYAKRYEFELEKAIDSDREEYGTIGRIEEYQNSSSESGEYVPGLDSIYNRDPI